MTKSMEGRTGYRERERQEAAWGLLQSIPWFIYRSSKMHTCSSPADSIQRLLLLLVYGSDQSSGWVVSSVPPGWMSISPAGILEVYDIDLFFEYTSSHAAISLPC